MDAPGMCPTCLNRIYTNKSVTEHQSYQWNIIFHIRGTDLFLSSGVRLCRLCFHFYIHCGDLTEGTDQSIKYFCKQLKCCNALMFFQISLPFSLCRWPCMALFSIRVPSVETGLICWIFWWSVCLWSPSSYSKSTTLIYQKFPIHN